MNLVLQCRELRLVRLIVICCSAKVTGQLYDLGFNMIAWRGALAWNQSIWLLLVAEAQLGSKSMGCAIVNPTRRFVIV